MVRPNSASAYPSSLFRVIKVPVARQHHEGACKPNPTIVKKLGGYHRRVIDRSTKKKSTILNMFKSAVKTIKNAFRLPPSPLIRRIQQLEDDIRLLQHKNEVLEKEYTIEGNHDEDVSSEMGEESSTTQPRASEDVISCEGIAATPIPTDDPLVAASKQASVVDCQSASVVIESVHDAAIAALTIPVPPPAPPLPLASTSSFGPVPVAPPAPPIGAPLPLTRPRASTHEQMPLGAQPAAAPRSEQSAFQNTSSRGGGVSLNDILGVQLRQVQPIRKEVTKSAFGVSVEDLFSVPLKPVRRRGRPPARQDDSDNEDFRILRAAMKQRIESLYSPSVSVAASDREWSVSPGFRSRQTAGPQI